jgi:single-strand DNA-binding protein
MNAITLNGNLTEDPKLVHAGERPICEMRLAVDNGRHPTTYIDVRTFDKQADACADYLHKGSKIGVNGRLAYDEWRAADGTSRHTYSVLGHVEFLDPPPGRDGQPERSEPQSDAPLPVGAAA